MNTLKTVGLTAIVALVVTLVVGPMLSKTQVVKQTQQSFGAVATPDIQSPYYSVGGQRVWKNRSDSLLSSTTPYSYQSPAATTTLSVFGCRLATASSTATTITLAKATVPNATTTLLATASLGAGAQGTIVASTTAAGGVNPDGLLIIAPNTYLTVGIANAISPTDTAGTGFTPRGSCDTVLTEI